MRRVRWVVVVVATMAVVGACTGLGDEGTEAPVGQRPGDGIEVVIGRPDRSDGYTQAAIYAALLRELGYSASDPARNEFPAADGYRVLADGGIDVWPDSHDPGHGPWLAQQLDDGSIADEHVLIVGDQTPDGALEGLLVTAAVADEHGVTSLDQIDGDPELVAVFDTDGNGLANVFGCPASWSCHDVIEATIARNGWDNLEQTRSAYDGLMTESINRVNAGDPTIQYAWSPVGHLAVLVPGGNVRWLSLGGEQFVCDGMDPCHAGWDAAATGPVSLGSSCTEDPCWLGWSSSSVRVAVNRSFAEGNPAAVRLLELIEIEVGDAIEHDFRYRQDGGREDDVRAYADQWIAANRQLVDQWLAAAIVAG